MIAILCLSGAGTGLPPGVAAEPMSYELVHTGNRYDALFDLLLRGKRGWAVGEDGLLLATRDAPGNLKRPRRSCRYWVWT
jgi:hypothetical protein